MPDWLTYQQIGERFGLRAEAARTRVRRLGWRTQPGNDGRTLALVPDDADLRPGGVRAAEPPGDREADREVTGTTALMAGALTALEQQLAAANERADAALALADRTLAQLADATAARDRAEAATTGERARADLLLADLDTARAEAREAIADANSRADRAEAAITGELLRADVLRDKLDTLRYDLDMARQAAAEAAEALRVAEAERRGRGRLRRVRDAWRGE